MKNSLSLNYLWLLLTILCAAAGNAFAAVEILPSDFVTVWQTDNPGSSGKQELVLPGRGTYVIYFESIPAGDSGMFSEFDDPIDGSAYLFFSRRGTYRLILRPLGPEPFHGMGVTGDSKKLLRVEQWGTAEWSIAVGAFSGCSNLKITATDVPNMRKVTDMSGMFFGCTSLTDIPRINEWDVSNVTIMHQMFANAIVFNQSLDNWKVNKVVSMRGMFWGAESFNQPLHSWDVSNVAVMEEMFFGAKAFNQPLDSWNVSNVTNFKGTFSDAVSFNQPLNSWNVSKTTEMARMFSKAAAFNQPLNNWSVDNVSSFDYMFNGASSFNQPLDNWNVRRASTCAYMFAEATAFNQPLDNWKVSNVTTFDHMFYRAKAFNQPLNSWKVMNAVSVSYMFYEATAFNQSLNNWTLNASVDTKRMFTLSGVDCVHYTNTLIGWAENLATPFGRTLDATGLIYGVDASEAREYLLDFKEWTIIGDTLDPTCTVFPVTLASFDAKEEGGAALLQWSTTEELNSDYFEIQRGVDLHSWESIGRVASNGKSQTLRVYKFTDGQPIEGVSYYRLKMVDIDKRYSYSRTRNFKSDGGSNLSIYPNPTSDRLIFKNVDMIKQIMLYDARGTKTLEDNSVTAYGIDVSNLAPGVYSVSIVLHDGGRKVHKVLVR